MQEVCRKHARGMQEVCRKYAEILSAMYKLLSTSVANAYSGYVLLLGAN